MLETFALRLALGLALSLFLLPAQTVAARFFRIHLLVVLSLGALAAAMVGENCSDLFWVALGVALGGCFVGSLFWAAENIRTGLAMIGLVSGCLAACLIGLPPRPSPLGPTGLYASDLATALLLGTSTTAMLMGHWYLIAPTMSLMPLMRLLAGLAVALLVRTTVAGVDTAACLARNGVALDSASWTWLGLRWAAGLIGAAVLTWMAWQSARIRSTQSATGILYVVVIFCFIGELTDQLLAEHWVGRISESAANVR